MICRDKSSKQQGKERAGEMECEQQGYGESEGGNDGKGESARPCTWGREGGGGARERQQEKKIAMGWKSACSWTDTYSKTDRERQRDTDRKN